MAVWGKVLGAFFGFLLGGPFGLLLGLFFGHKFDKARQNLSFGGGFGGGFNSDTQYAHQQAYFHATFAVMGHMAKAKGQVTESEIRLASILMDRMALDAGARRKAQEAFREGKDSFFPLEEVLKKIKRSCAGRHDLLQLFLEVQIQAAYADGHLHARELDVLYKISEQLGFSRHQLDQMIKMQEAAFNFHQQGHGSRDQKWSPAHSAVRLDDAYKILGVELDDNGQTIKRAYRKLMNEHHPDKLAAKGLPPEMMEMTKQKAQEIQAAYDLIKRDRGFK